MFSLCLLAVYDINIIRPNEENLCFLRLGVWANIEMSQTSMEVVKGKLVQLIASYVGNPNADLATSTIIWNFVTDSTQQVRRQFDNVCKYSCSFLPSCKTLLQKECVSVPVALNLGEPVLQKAFSV